MALVYSSTPSASERHVDQSLQDNYARGGFGKSLQPGVAPALLIIDFVQAYTLPSSALYANCEAARRGAVALLGAARAARIPIIHTRVAFQRGGRDGGVFFRKVPALASFTPDADPALGSFAPGLEPAEGETIITKQYASAFFGTTLSSTLAALQIDTLLIAGVSTSGCVRATAVDSCQHGYIPLVVRDAVGDRAREPHEASLFDLQAKYAEVIGLAEALAYVGSNAGTAG
jgi:maleamate amidohydrolase